MKPAASLVAADRLSSSLRPIVRLRKTLLALGLLLTTFGAAPSSAASSSTGTPSELGLELIPWSKKLAERRYESPRDWDATRKFFHDKFKGIKTIKWTREVSLPSVKYVHITNTAAKGKWDGINIYQLPDGRVRYYLLARAPSPAAPSSPAAPGKATADPNGAAKAKAPPGPKTPSG